MNPAADLQAGETVLVTVPATVTSTGGAGAVRETYQLTAALPTADTTLDLRGLPPGLYVLRLALDGQATALRVVIE